MEASVLPSVFFCRKIRFHARHHYALPGAVPSENLRVFGEASQPHGHDWELTLWMEGPLHPKTGMIADLVHVDQVLEEEVRRPFHQAHINEVDPFFRENQPTTEVLASYFADKLQPRLEPVRIARLRIAETSDLFAEWIP